MSLLPIKSALSMSLLPIRPPKTGYENFKNKKTNKLEKFIFKNQFFLTYLTDNLKLTELTKTFPCSVLVKKLELAPLAPKKTQSKLA